MDINTITTTLSDIDWTTAKHLFFIAVGIMGLVHIGVTAIKVTWKIAKSLAKVAMVAGVVVIGYSALMHVIGPDDLIEIFRNLDLSILKNGNVPEGF